MNRMPRLEAQAPLWVAARWVVLLITVGLIVGFWVLPEPSLRLLWYALIPPLPAVFLLNAQLWRNVCPLATLNVLGGSRVGSRLLQREWVRTAGAVGIVLLAVMVPARRFLFNGDGVALAVTVGVVCVLAVVGGLLFDMKAGFCNAVCPVLPVERLYGQRPLVTVPNARCTPCSTCTRQGCLDLAPEKSALQVLGDGRSSARWMWSAYGIFALGFPGFVLAYYLLEDVPLSGAPGVYGTVALWTAGSWAATAAAFSILRVPVSKALIVCAALAVGLYYWFAPPGIATQFGLPASFTWGARLVALALVGWWLTRALGDDGSRGRASGGAAA